MKLDYLRLHWVADGDVSLDSEGSERQGGGVHGEELTEDKCGAANRAPHPQVSQYVVGQNLLR